MEILVVNLVLYACIPNTRILSVIAVGYIYRPTYSITMNGLIQDETMVNSPVWYCKAFTSRHKPLKCATLGKDLEFLGYRYYSRGRQKLADRGLWLLVVRFHSLANIFTLSFRCTDSSTTDSLLSAPRIQQFAATGTKPPATRSAIVSLARRQFTHSNPSVYQWTGLAGNSPPRTISKLNCAA